MDYQPIDQPNQESSNKTWYAIAVVVIVAILALWYFSGNKALAPTTDSSSSAVEQMQIPTLSGGNTTADISNDLNQIPDTSAALDADASASAQAVQDF